MNAELVADMERTLWLQSEKIIKLEIELARLRAALEKIILVDSNELSHPRGPTIARKALGLA